MQLTEKVNIVRIQNNNIKNIDDTVIVEFPLTIFVNGSKIETLVCSPSYIDELAVGYLFSEGIIQKVNDIKFIEHNKDKVLLQITHNLNANGKNGQKIKTVGNCKTTFSRDLNNFTINDEKDNFVVNHTHIHEMMDMLYNKSELFKQTGGAHDALLVDTKTGFNIIREDIGRHNAVDKIIGHMILNQISSKNKAMVVSCRISAEILLKTARRKIPIIISCAAPTNLAIDFAESLGVTIIGFVRNKRMNIYTHKNRVI